ncbi:MerR family transcriptional regulator [Geomonas sp. Red69]|uniref:MerR family transcriptional regulator n=1 Tax=Geomonas diazotrophica TaxID=2843197 RepID=A0ABX8JHI4_9BACT|nr:MULTISPECIES: MerR family transcriptional regulator [Geomonas]MBU5636252.1 MerR family transcriptional regulator [Geomonas diazotrophica]QWV96147.1 MerR family transcriptional regulator [Geomonas nitrogeniifigens]QXE85214.1 MerR family transcriptional regulator [Geomonas nitrogeniifigens]
MTNEQREGETIVSISDLAKDLGLTTRTLRYWEEVGIVESVERQDGATRGYTPYYVRRIKFIMKLKELGLTIKEMQDLYAAYGDAKQTEKMIPRLIETLDQHVAKVDEKMAQLASLRQDIVGYRQKMMKQFAIFSAAER